jgi:transcriptional regulator with XRE-family HTH domain
MADGDKDAETMRFVFREAVRGLRREKGLGIDEFARKSGIERANVIAMERNPRYKPTPLVLHKLSRFYKVSQRKLATLAGAIKEASPSMQAEASRFAAQSESFSKLTDEEQRTLDEFVRFLRAEDDVK